jgi:HTH-type transcriptional regulator/antitoxin HigA
MKLFPIRNDADHEKAAREIERLMDLDPAPDSDDDVMLDALATLVDAYEAKRWPLKAAGDPVDVLHATIEDDGRTQKELADLLGSPSRASEVLNRKRALTLPMIHKIAEAWHIPAEMLIRPYELVPSDAGTARRQDATTRLRGKRAGKRTVRPLTKRKAKPAAVRAREEA